MRSNILLNKAKMKWRIRRATHGGTHDHDAHWPLALSAAMAALNWTLGLELVGAISVLHRLVLISGSSAACLYLLTTGMFSFFEGLSSSLLFSIATAYCFSFFAAKPVPAFATSAGMSGAFALATFLVASFAVVLLVQRVRQLTRTCRSDKALDDLQTLVVDEIQRSSFEEMGASIAHDIAQPMSAIVLHGQACLRWLKQDNSPKEEVSACVERMTGDAYRVSATVARIREQSRRKPPDLRHTSVNNVILAAAPLIERRLSLSSVRLALNLAPALPDALADAALLQQILIILTQSRLHLFESGLNASIRITVSTRVSTSGDIVIAIADSGPAMAASDLDGLFDISGNADPGRMQLKLAACRSLVEAQSGDMTAANNVPRGMIFTFNLPAA